MPHTKDEAKKIPFLRQWRTHTLALFQEFIQKTAHGTPNPLGESKGENYSFFPPSFSIVFVHDGNYFSTCYQATWEKGTRRGIEVKSWQRLSKTDNSS